MASITFAVDDELKADMNHFSWVNWSEVARKNILKDVEKSAKLQKALKIVSKSKFTEKDADILTIKVKASMHKKLKEAGLL